MTRSRSLLQAAAASALLLAASCGSAPEPPGGGASASKAAYAEGERYAKGLSRGIDRAARDRALGALEAARRGLEQHAADRSGYPEASSCAELSAALETYRVRIPEADPYGAPFECRSAAGGYSIRSAGEDGRVGTGDDLAVESGAP